MITQPRNISQHCPHCDSPIVLKRVQFLVFHHPFVVITKRHPVILENASSWSWLYYDWMADIKLRPNVNNTIVILRIADVVIIDVFGHWTFFFGLKNYSWCCYFWGWCYFYSSSFQKIFYCCSYWWRMRRKNRRKNRKKRRMMMMMRMNKKRRKMKKMHHPKNNHPNYPNQKKR